MFTLFQTAVVFVLYIFSIVISLQQSAITVLPLFELQVVVASITIAITTLPLFELHCRLL